MILQDIALRTKERIAEQKKIASPFFVRGRAEMMAGTEKMRGGFTYPFERAVAKEGLSLICEVKRASPSKGVICDDFPALDIAGEYSKGGADALSVLTEPFFFFGGDEYLRDIAARVPLPALRKDFTVDGYMIYEAKLLGASAVLLICSLLTDGQLVKFMSIAERLGLSALVEAHTADEVKRALDCGARVIGVNNRNLETFEVDISAAERLRPLVPRDVLYVAESGIFSPADAERMRAAGADGILVGEALMRSADRAAAVRAFKGG